MRSITQLLKRSPSIALATLALTAAGCGLERQSAPSIVAPSEFGLSVTGTVTPDQIPRDGESQAIVTVRVRDARGEPVAGQRLLISASVGTVGQSDMGTDEAGNATFVYTAPVASTIVASGVAVIAVTPTAGSAGDAAARTFTVRLTGTPNAGAPVAAFSFLPAAPEVLQTVAFDAGASTDEGTVCRDACTYAWDFGGEATGTGRTATHRFQQARSYVVRLTVTDAVGTTGTTTQAVAVVNPAAPTPVFVASPSSPAIQQNVNFVASGSTAAAGHSLVQYDWSFGDGSTSSSTASTSSHAYASTGTYTVTLTVTDDVGQRRTVTSTVTVVNGLTASFSVSPTSQVITRTVNVNGTESTTVAGATIQSYTWDFGNGETATGSTASTTYATAGTYTIRLTVVDSAGRTSTTTRTVTITAT
ncbi:MAG: PKD domain-containing protein [Vicinamibacterales bacterium]